MSRKLTEALFSLYNNLYIHNILKTFSYFVWFLIQLNFVIPTATGLCLVIIISPLSFNISKYYIQNMLSTLF